MVAFLTETFPCIYIHTNIEQQQTLHELNAVIACITLKYHKSDLIRDTSLTSAAPCLPLPLLLLSVKKKPLRFQLFGWICASGSTHLLSKQLHCPSLPSSIAYLFLKSRPWSREEAGAPLTAHSRWVTCVIQEEGPETPSRPAAPARPPPPPGPAQQAPRRESGVWRQGPAGSPAPLVGSSSRRERDGLLSDTTRLFFGTYLLICLGKGDCRQRSCCWWLPRVQVIGQWSWWHCANTDTVCGGRWSFFSVHPQSSWSRGRGFIGPQTDFWSQKGPLDHLASSFV